MKSNAKDMIHRLQLSRFVGEPLLPLILNDPNFHPAATGSDELETFRSRSSLRDVVTASVFQNYTKINSTLTRNESERTPDTRDSSTLRRLLKNYWCPQAKTCAQLWIEHSHTDYLSTGHDSLDRLLGGGLRTNEIMELLGKSATGKTQLCLNMCAKVLLQHPNRTILYLDTKSDFDPARIHWLLENEFQNEPNSELTISCLRRIRVASVPTIDLLTETLVRTRILLAYKLESVGSNGHDQSSADLSPRTFFENLVMIVVDSLATPFVPYMGPLPQLAKSQLSVISVELSRIASVLHCAVLVVNHSRSSKLADQKGFNEERRNLGCLGVSWAAVPHKRLVLTLSNEHIPNSERKLHVLIKLSKDANSQIPCPCGDTTFSSCIVKFSI